MSLRVASRFLTISATKYNIVRRHIVTSQSTSSFSSIITTDVHRLENEVVVEKHMNIVQASNTQGSLVLRII